MRRAGRVVAAWVPLGLGVVAAAAVIAGSFRSLAALGPGDAALLLFLAITIAWLGWRRLSKDAAEQRIPWRDEAELGGLLIVTGYALIQPLGGVFGPFYPLLYVLFAFLVSFSQGAVAAGLTAFAIALEAAGLGAEGALPARAPALAGHAAFLFVFAGLSRLVHGSHALRDRATGVLAARAKVKRFADDARLFRLRVAGVEPGREEDEARQAEAERKWVTAAVAEVNEAVSNALEVAECALRAHSVAVFLVHGDDRILKLHEARSQAEQLRLDGFDAREGLVGAALQRRVPMRLCGELKGVTWYDGRVPVRSVLFAPLLDRRGAREVGRDDGYLRGLVIADRLEPEPFTPADERILVATTREVLRAIETERVMGYIRRAREEKALLYASIEKLNGASKPEEVFQTTLDVVKEITGRKPLELLAFTTVATDRQTGEIVHKVEKVEGPVASSVKTGSFPDNRCLVANAVRYGAILPGRELRAMERVRIFEETPPFRSLQALKVIPLRAGKAILGTLVCGSKRRGALDPEMVRTLEVIAMQAAQSLERARLFEQTERMALTDGLTGLVNHRTFQGRFADELARTSRSGRKATLVLIDIDHFKAVNDTYGHATGDLVLKGIAEEISGCARATDTVARYGGEEFALLLPETDTKGGKDLAERIRKAVEARSFATDLGPLKCTVSLGVATYPDVSQEAIFDAADQCLYHCKRMGRNRSATLEEASIEGRKKAAGDREPPAP